jgi:hypothetical protein
MPAQSCRREACQSVGRSPFAGAVRTSVTLMGQDIGNTVTVLVHVLILSSELNIGQQNDAQTYPSSPRAGGL